MEAGLVPPTEITALTNVSTAHPVNGTKRAARQAGVNNASSTALVAQHAPPAYVFNEDDLRNFLIWPEYTYFGGFIQFNKTT